MLRSWMTTCVLGVTAFQQQHLFSTRTPSLRSVAPEQDSEALVAPPTEEELTPPRPRAARRVRNGNQWYNLALPFLPRPRYLDGTLAADSGFDPLSLTNSKVELYNYREAEIKHCRLAMLGAAGWPLAELFDTQIANVLGLPSLIEANNGRDPSLLNGGLGLVSPLYWVIVLGFAAAVEIRGETLKAQQKSTDKAWMLSGSWVPGDLRFDPLNLYTTFGDTPRAKYLMETAEIKNGRLAMVAIVVFVIEEFLTGKPVVEITPILFEPLPKVVEDIMFSAPSIY